MFYRKQARPVAVRPVENLKSSPGPFEAESETAAEYKPHVLPPRHEAPPPSEAAPSDPFDGKTTYGEDFTPKAGQKRQPYRHTDEWRPEDGKFHSTTESGDAFKGWKLPGVSPSLGVALSDGSFHRLLGRNWQSPCQANAVVTTIVDNQTEIQIKVLQGESMQASENKLLGQFRLVNMPPANIGDPQIEVAFVIDSSNVLHVAARDSNTGRTQEIVITELEHA